MTLIKFKKEKNIIYIIFNDPDKIKSRRLDSNWLKQDLTIFKVYI